MPVNGHCPAVWATLSLKNLCWHTHDGVLSSNESEWIIDTIYSNMNECYKDNVESVKIDVI
jgi:hypothetical protein